MSNDNGNGKVSTDQRYSASNPCPVCGGHEGLQRGRSERCVGYLAGSGKFAFCSRVNADDPIETAAGPVYKHRLDQVDRRVIPPPTNGKPRGKGHRTPQEAVKSLARWMKQEKGIDLGRLSGNWTYHDQGGRPVLVVFRFDRVDPETGERAKTYRPVHRGDDHRWRSGDPSGPLPLYRLPTLAEADLVVICEGEKAADAVRDLGLIATTPPHGAESPHRADWSSLAGKVVVILPDNDEPGRKFAAKVIELLKALDPRPTIKVVELPDLPEKGDAHDWKEAGGTAEQLRALIDAVEPVASSNGKPPTTTNEPTIDLGDLASRPRTEFGLAERFRTRFGSTVRYCHPWGKFLVWDGRRWKIDDKARVRQLGKRVVRGLYKEAEAIIDDDDRRKFVAWALRCEAKKTLDAFLSLVTHDEDIPVVPEEMDRDPWILNVENGTIDLKTGRLRPHDPANLVTKLCPIPFDPSATCPTFDAFIDHIFEGRRDLIRFVQALCGYLLTGNVGEQVLPILHGIGANGKSTLTATLLDVFGPDYAMKAPADLLMLKRSQGHPTELADLFGKRLVVASETGEGARLNESLVKELTGSEKIRARKMRQDFWEFDPTHKVLLCTNHKPAIRGTDHAIWRRIRLVPFSVVIPDEDQDKALDAKLRQELPGILAWCVRGCLDWQRDGLKPPDEVIQATSEYRDEEDVLRAFIEEHCVIGKQFKAKASELYGRYGRWTKESGENTLSQTRFGKALGERGYDKSSSNGIWYKGIGLRQENEESQAEFY